jgi:hypothetical protein
MDNVFIEWLWRSLKYECVYLHAFKTARNCAPGWRDRSATIMPSTLTPTWEDKPE